MAVTNDIRFADAGLFAAIRKQVAAMKTAYAQNLVFRQTVAEMSKLTDRDLTDLGIARSEIRNIALEAARRS